MWQRFSENARKVVYFAQEEAQKLGEGYISTEHLLLGLTREECAASRVLLSLRLEPSFLRAEVFRNVPRNESLQDSDISLTPRGKRVIDLAYDEARLLNDDFIGTEHLLLGLVREEAGLAGRILKKAGLNVDRTREAVVTVRGGEPPAPRARPQRPLQRIKHSFGLHDRQDAAFSMFLSLQPTARTCLLVLAVMDHSPRLAMALQTFGIHPQDFSCQVVAESIRRVENATVVELSLKDALVRASVLAEGGPIDPGHLVLAILAQDEPLRVRVGLDEAQLAALAAAINADR